MTCPPSAAGAGADADGSDVMARPQLGRQWQAAMAAQVDWPCGRQLRWLLVLESKAASSTLIPTSVVGTN